MISFVSKKLARLKDLTHAGVVSYGFGPGVHTSTYPLTKGGTLQPKVKKSEANSGSSNPAVLRSQESNGIKKPGVIQIRTHFKESDTNNEGNRFRVVLIEEGLGNLRSCFYYTKEALQSAVPLFEGAKCFADHPTMIEEQTRPERSTRDILGYFEKVAFEEIDGRGRLCADFVLMEGESFDWARSLLTNSLDYAKKYQDSEFVGFSINADGSAQPVGLENFLQSASLPKTVIPKLMKAKEEGVSEINLVNSFVDATSCDLVTEAGAGGKILKMIEQERKPMKKKALESKEMEKKEKKEAEGDHADAEQDKALFAKMIKQYLGEEIEGEEAEEAMEMAKEAYQAHKEEGMEADEAYEASGKHLKMAMSIGKKMSQKQKDKEAKETEDKKECGMQADEAEEKETHEADEEKEDKEEKEEKKETKESASSSLRAQLLKEKAENARLRESLKRYELGDYLEKKLAESKKPVSVTKKFREALGTPKSKDHIDQSYKLFMHAYEAKEDDASGDWYVFGEKTTTTVKESKKDAEQGLSFTDCLN